MLPSGPNLSKSERYTNMLVHGLGFRVISNSESYTNILGQPLRVHVHGVYVGLNTPYVHWAKVYYMTHDLYIRHLVSCIISVYF